MLKWLNRLFWLGLFFAALGIAAISAFYFTLESSLPDVTSLREASLETPLRIYSADDALIAEYGEMRRIPLKIADIPQPMLDAFLAFNVAKELSEFEKESEILKNILEKGDEKC